MSIGERIAIILEDANWTQTRFSEIINTNITTLNAWITNSSKPKLKQIINIADITNYNLHWLLTGDGEPKPVKSEKGLFFYADVAGTSNFSDDDDVLFLKKSFNVVKLFSLQHFPYRAIFEMLENYTLMGDFENVADGFDFDDDNGEPDEEYEVEDKGLKELFDSMEQHFPKPIDKSDCVTNSTNNYRSYYLSQVFTPRYLLFSDTILLFIPTEIPSFNDTELKRRAFYLKIMFFSYFIQILQFYCAQFKFFWRGELTLNNFTVNGSGLRILGKAPKEIGKSFESHKFIGFTVSNILDSYIEDMYTLINNSAVNSCFHKYNVPYINKSKQVIYKERWTLPYLNFTKFKKDKLFKHFYDNNIKDDDDPEFSALKLFPDILLKLKNLPFETKYLYDNTVEYYASVFGSKKPVAKKLAVKLRKWLKRPNTFTGNPAPEAKSKEKPADNHADSVSQKYFDEKFSKIMDLQAATAINIANLTKKCDKHFKRDNPTEKPSKNTAKISVNAKSGKNSTRKPTIK